MVNNSIITIIQNLEDLSHVDIIFCSMRWPGCAVVIWWMDDADNHRPPTPQCSCLGPGSPSFLCSGKPGSSLSLWKPLQFCPELLNVHSHMSGFQWIPGTRLASIGVKQWQYIHTPMSSAVSEMPASDSRPGLPWLQGWLSHCDTPSSVTSRDTASLQFLRQT
jgi:hypothetical protein